MGHLAKFTRVKFYTFDNNQDMIKKTKGMLLLKLYDCDNLIFRSKCFLNLLRLPMNPKFSKQSVLRVILKI